jgi:hypothetical protein
MGVQAVVGVLVVMSLGLGETGQQQGEGKQKVMHETSSGDGADVWRSGLIVTL